MAIYTFTLPSPVPNGQQLQNELGAAVTPKIINLVYVAWNGSTNVLAVDADAGIDVPTMQAVIDAHIPTQSDVLPIIYTDLLYDFAVTRVKIAYGAVGYFQLDDGAVNTAKIADGAINRDKIEDGEIPLTKLDVLPKWSLVGNKFGDDVGGGFTTPDYIEAGDLFQLPYTVDNGTFLGQPTTNILQWGRPDPRCFTALGVTAYTTATTTISSLNYTNQTFPINVFSHVSLETALGGDPYSLIQNVTVGAITLKAIKIPSGMDGRWLVGCATYPYTTAGGVSIEFGPAVNGALFSIKSLYGSAGNNIVADFLEGVVSLNAGDYVTMMVKQTTFSAAPRFLVGGSLYPKLWAYYLGH